MAKRQVIVMRSVDPADESGLPALGTLREVREILARFNTSGDDATGKPDMGVVTMYGPGMVLEVPTAQDEIKQLMVTMTDDDFAFPVLMRLCREQKWTLMDPETGQRLRFGG